MNCLRPSERRYARMLAKVTPWPADVVEMVVASCGSRSRVFLDEVARENRDPLETLDALHSVLASAIEERLRAEVDRLTPNPHPA